MEHHPVENFSEVFGINISFPEVTLQTNFTLNQIFLLKNPFFNMFKKNFLFSIRHHNLIRIISWDGLKALFKIFDN